MKKIIRDIKESYEFYKIRRYLRKSDLLVMTEIKNFNNPAMYISSDLNFIKYLYKHGVDFNTFETTGKTANIIFSPKEQKWYGWSHRAIYGFGIGTTVEEGDIVCGIFDKTTIDPGYKIETLEDAKKLAIIFANEVS